MIFTMTLRRDISAPQSSPSWCIVSSNSMPQCMHRKVHWDLQSIIQVLPHLHSWIAGQLCSKKLALQICTSWNQAWGDPCSWVTLGRSSREVLEITFPLHTLTFECGCVTVVLLWCLRTHEAVNLFYDSTRYILILPGGELQYINIQSYWIVTGFEWWSWIAPPGWLLLWMPLACLHGRKDITCQTRWNWCAKERLKLTSSGPRAVNGAWRGLQFAEGSFGTQLSSCTSISWLLLLKLYPVPIIATEDWTSYSP